MEFDDEILFMDEIPYEEKECMPKVKWKVLIVDDDEDIHTITEFALSGVSILDKGFDFLHAFSAREGKNILINNPDIAVILLDVVMETNDAGLNLVSEIRDELKLDELRIILRTGQPGYAPELSVIQKYDINDYKTKSELTRNKLITSLTTALRSYQQMCILNNNSLNLGKIIHYTNKLFSIHNLQKFLDELIVQLTELFSLNTRNGMICTINSSVNHEKDDYIIIKTSEKYNFLTNSSISQFNYPQIYQKLKTSYYNKNNYYDSTSTVLYFKDSYSHEIIVYIDIGIMNKLINRQMLDIYSANLCIGYNNISLIERLNDEAYYDKLTGLSNKNFCIDYFDNLENKDNKCVILFSINNFTDITNVIGYDNGNLLIVSVTSKLLSAYPKTVFISRIDENKFIIVSDKNEIIPEKINSIFNESFYINGIQFKISISCGIVYPEILQDKSSIEIIRAAHLALHTCRKDNKKTFCYYSEYLDKNSKDTFKLTHELLQAIIKEEFKVYYQPQIDLKTKKVSGAECLLRWIKPDGKVIMPMDFIPLAEESGLIVPLTNFVLETAFSKLSELKNNGIENIVLAVNISSDYFYHPEFIDVIMKNFEKYSINPDSLELEITESVEMYDKEEMFKILIQLKEMGIKIAMDDFGTGFSSIGYLNQLPIDRLKIDKEFIFQLTEPNGDIIPKTIISMAHALGFKVIAEGIESEAHESILCALGCEEGQGYLYARAIDYDAFLKFIRK